jgi:type IV pilus assembly protein PilM
VFARGKTTTVGLDIGASSVKLVELEHDENGVRLVGYGEKRLEPDVIVDGEIMDRQMVVEAIRGLFDTRGVVRRRVVVGVHGRGVIVKKIVMDRMSAQDAGEAIYWEAEQHVPYDINDIALDFEILDVDKGPKQMQVLLVAAKRDLILNLAEVIREAGLIVEAVDVNGFAAQNALDRAASAKPGEVVALLNVGADITNVNVVRDGIPLHTQDLSLGTNSLLQSIQKTYHLSREEVERSLQENPPRLDVAAQLEAFGADLSASLDKSLNYLRTSGDAESLSRILVCGGGAQIDGLLETLGRLQPAPVTLGDPLGGLRWDEAMLTRADAANIGPRLAVGVGLALRKERPQ